MTGKGHCGYRVASAFAAALPDDVHSAILEYYKQDTKHMSAGLKAHFSRNLADEANVIVGNHSPSWPKAADMKARQRGLHCGRQYWFSVMKGGFALAHMSGRTVYIINSEGDMRCDIDVDEETMAIFKSAGGVAGDAIAHGDTWVFPGNGGKMSRTFFNELKRKPANDAIVMVYDGVHFGGAMPVHMWRKLKKAQAQRSGRRRAAGLWNNWWS